MTPTVSGLLSITASQVIQAGGFVEGKMHNRQAISLPMFWESITDYDLWPLYLVRVALLFDLSLGTYADAPP